MKITYTAPNRSHHYPYAEALHRAGYLHAFVSGFSRFSPRSSLPSIGDKLKRHDLLKNIHLLCLKSNFPAFITSKVDQLSAAGLDFASYRWAKESDVFIYYRTDGYTTTKKLHKAGNSTLCVMEEVNSHVEVAHGILREEFRHLKLEKNFEKDSDYNLRLKTYEQADCILCPSEFVRRSFLSKGFSAERILKVNFGFPPIQLCSGLEKKINNKTFRLLYVGQLHYRKGLRFAIEAFRNLKHPNKEFVIVGPKASITGLERTTMPEGVIFTGPLKGEALREQYLRASVFILPSLEEGLALVQGEALSAGLPLLITTNTGGEDLIKDGVEGFIVEPAMVMPLANRLQQMADDQDLLKRMSAAALIAAKNTNSWDRTVEILISELKNLRVV